VAVGRTVGVGDGPTTGKVGEGTGDVDVGVSPASAAPHAVTSSTNTTANTTRIGIMARWYLTIEQRSVTPIGSGTAFFHPNSLRKRLLCSLDQLRMFLAILAVERNRRIGLYKKTFRIDDLSSVFEVPLDQLEVTAGLLNRAASLDQANVDRGSAEDEGSDPRAVETMLYAALLHSLGSDAALSLDKISLPDPTVSGNFDVGRFVESCDDLNAEIILQSAGLSRLNMALRWSLNPEVSLGPHDSSLISESR
jgi:hypothetical protein